MTDLSSEFRERLNMDRRIKHGMSQSPEYSTWWRILGRCYNPRNSKFAWYGGRGISVCERWRGSFQAFLGDMGRRPSPKHSIERTTNDGNYEPENCRWATQVEQSRNTQRTVFVTFRGRTQCLTDWASELGINRRTVEFRLDAGWSVERALEETVKTPTFHMLTWEGETMSLSDWALRIGIKKSTLSARLHKGWPLKLALTTPSSKGKRVR